MILNSKFEFWKWSTTVQQVFCWPKKIKNAQLSISFVREINNNKKRKSPNISPGLVLFKTNWVFHFLFSSTDSYLLLPLQLHKSLSKIEPFDFSLWKISSFRFHRNNGEERWDFGYGYLFPSHLCSTGKKSNFDSLCLLRFYWSYCIDILCFCWTIFLRFGT